MKVHERLYRVLLAVLPVEHRRAYGEPMAQMFRDRMRDEGGGVRSAAIWAHAVADLAKSAVVERTETTMEMLKNAWWRIAAGLVASVLAVGAVGVFTEPGSGPWWKQVFGGGALVVAPVLIVAGLVLRRRITVVGNVLIAVGVVPGAFAMVLFWFPPALAFGLLSTSVLIAALVDAVNIETARRTRSEPVL